MPRSEGRQNRKIQCEECIMLDAREILVSRTLPQASLERRTLIWNGGLACSGGATYVDASAMVDIDIRDSFPLLRLSYSLDQYTRWPRDEPDGVPGQDERISYEIRTIATRQQLGGYRYWFICPGVVNGQICSRRVRILYMPQGAYYFLCRHCYDLVYQRQQESGTRMEKLRHRYRMTNYELRKWLEQSFPHT